MSYGGHSFHGKDWAATAAALAAAYATMGGSLAAEGGAAGAGADAAAGAGAADAAAGAAGASAAGTATAEELAAQQALAQAAPQGLGNTLDASLANTGYTPSSLWNALNNPSATAISAVNNNTGAGISQTGLLGSGSSTGKGAGLLASQLGMKMIQPQQPQAPMGHPMGGGGGSSAPLPQPYGTTAGNSLGFTEEQKKRLRAMGVQI